MGVVIKMPRRADILNLDFECPRCGDVIPCENPRELQMYLQAGQCDYCNQKEVKNEND